MENTLDNICERLTQRNTSETNISELVTDTKLEVIGHVEMFDNAWTEARMWIIQAEQALQSVQSVDTTESLERLALFVKNISDVVLKEVKTVAEQCIDFANALMNEQKEDTTVEKTENLESQIEVRKKQQIEPNKAATDADIFSEDSDIQKQFSILEKASEYSKETKPKRTAKKSPSESPKQATKAVRTTRGNLTKRDIEPGEGSFDIDCFNQVLNIKKEFSVLAEVSLADASEHTQEPIPKRTVKKNQADLPKKVTETLKSKPGNLKAHSKFSCKICKEDHGSKRGLENHIAEKHMVEGEPIRCMKCDREIAGRREFIDHVRKNHPEVKPNECGACGAMTKNIYEHVRRTHWKRYNCSECGKCFSRFVRLADHHRTHTNEPMTEDDKPHSCKICGARFILPWRLRDHIITHSEPNKFQCPTCKKCFKEGPNLRKHIQKMNCRGADKDEIKAEPIQCAHCFLEIGDKFEFVKHMGLEHPEIPPNQCGACGRVVKDIAYHMSRVHSKRFKCNVCGKVKARKSELEVHKRTHTNEKPYMCEMCGKEFHSLECYKSHRKTHETKLHLCEICNKTFANEKYLKRHIKIIHCGMKSFVCEMCGKAYESERKLKRHKFSHTGVSDHYCTLCDKYFAIFSALIKHNDIQHRGLANKYKYRCPICARYIEKSSKKFHLLSHKGERNLTCKECGKAFTWPSALRAHRKTHWPARTKFHQVAVFQK